MKTEKSIRSLKELDHESFEIVFREYFRPLIAFAKKILVDEDDAKEVVHKVFISLWEKRQDIDLSVSLKSYLFTSVHNRSLNVIRDRKKFTSGELPDVAGEWDVSSLIESMELEKKVKEVIQLLPARCREIFELNRFEGLKYSDIAKQMDISVKTVENQMSKALKILREKLSKYITILLWLIMNALN